MSRLDEIDIKFLTGVGPKRAELLAEQLHIRTFYDLLYYFPFRYVDRSRIFQIRELESGMPFIQLKGRFVTMTTVGEGAKRRMQALFSDGTGTIDVVWFNRIKFVAENYRTGVEYVIFGRPSIFNASKRYSGFKASIRETAKQSAFKVSFCLPKVIAASPVRHITEARTTEGEKDARKQ